MSWTADAPVTAACLGVVLVALWIVCLIPSTPIELIMAYSYGLWGGFCLIYVGKVTGCAASFALGRTLGCGHGMLARFELARALALAVALEPWKILFLVRAAYIPIALKNYGMAALKAPPLQYFVSLVTVETYNTLEVVFIGATARSLGDAARSKSGDDAASAIGTGIAAVCLVGLGCYGALATRRALEQLRKEEEEEEASSDRGLL